MLLQFFSHLRHSYPAERRCLAPPTPPCRGSAFSVLASRRAPPLPATPSNSAPPPPSSWLCQPDVAKPAREPWRGQTLAAQPGSITPAPLDPLPPLPNTGLLAGRPTLTPDAPP
ncbi:hypothetical protein PVAP13_7NG161300 [Panicum virgatum]|uniref:Uncharacterized protein n=1 Tax=Panicum virgatum TaxID=38727 RepID=A0A8T0PVR3_PANVG|nr:hypothetical protein PVAP13_7NG161300 [Panicum virgatum]